MKSITKNQVEVANKIETLIIKSGFDYQMIYQPKTSEFIFVLRDKKLKKERKIDEKTNDK